MYWLLYNFKNVPATDNYYKYSSDRYLKYCESGYIVSFHVPTFQYHNSKLSISLVGSKNIIKNKFKTIFDYFKLSVDEGNVYLVQYFEK